MNVRYLGALGLALGFAIYTAGSAAAALTDPVAAAHQFVDGFNKGDVNSALAACAETTGIIDEFPPHTWTSCAAWANAYNANAKQNGVTDGYVVLGKPLHDDVTGNVAYAVFPATYTWKLKGKPMSENSLLTVVLKKSSSGWHIVAWSWNNK
jgi:hypothetical protein